MENDSNNQKEKELQNKSKSYMKEKNRKTNKNNPKSTFTQKRIYQKSLNDISLKKDFQMKALLNYENENKYNIKLDNNILSSVFNFNFENSTHPPILKNESILNFQKFFNYSFNLIESNQNNNINKYENFPPLFQYGSKYIIDDIHSSLYNIINCIIKIQGCIRGYLVKKKLKLNNIDKVYFDKKTINIIIKIQKNIRRFLESINIRKKIIIKLIHDRRKSAIDLIIKRMKIYINTIKSKRIFFINYYLEQRKIKAKYILETFRNYKFYKSFKQLKKEIDNNYFLYYPYNAKKVDIIIYFDDGGNKKKNKKYNFTYNNLLKYFILLINPCNFFSGKYKCQFVVNDIIIFDNRYPTIQNNNCFFNIIDLVQKNNIKCITKAKKEKNIIKNKDIKKNENNDLFKNKNNEMNSNNNNIYNCLNLKLSLEDIMEEDDEGKSVTSKDNRYEKRIKYLSDNSLKLYKNEENEKESKI